MINYWDFSGNYFDKIGSSDLYSAFNAYFVPNRYGKNNSAVRFKYGYISLPKGYYFTNEFSVTAWVYANSSSSGDNLAFIYLSNKSGYYLNTFRWGYQNRVETHYLVNGTWKLYVQSTPYSNNSTWVHVAFTYDGSYSRMYSNGTLSLTTSTQSLGFSSIKNFNYIGTGCGSPLSDFILDELKFFNRALNQTEIKNDMNLNN